MEQGTKDKAEEKGYKQIEPVIVSGFIEQMWRISAWAWHKKFGFVLGGFGYEVEDFQQECQYNMLKRYTSMLWAMEKGRSTSLFTVAIQTAQRIIYDANAVMRKANIGAYSMDYVVNDAGDSMVAAFDFMMGEKTDPIEYAIRREAIHNLEKAIAEVRQRALRRMLECVLIAGMDVKESAEALGLTERSARQVYYEARKALRKTLRKYTKGIHE